MDTDLDWRHFKKGGFDLDLDLKFTEFDLKKKSNPHQIHPWFIKRI